MQMLRVPAQARALTIILASACLVVSATSVVEPAISAAAAAAAVPPQDLIARTDAGFVRMHSDGTGRQTLTNTVGTPMFGDVDPAGKRLVYAGTVNGSSDIRAVGLDGAGATSLTTTGGKNQYPSYSADGSRITFDRYANGNTNIWSMSADGSGAVRLEKSSATDTEPRFSPDGKKIVYHAQSSKVSGDIYVINSDGSGTPTDLTPQTSTEASPDWSPDGSKIAFTSDKTGSNQIWVMDANGANQHPITTTGGITPAWSPDGTALAYSNGGDIWVTAADGSWNVQVTATPSVAENYPQWIPHSEPPTPAQPYNTSWPHAMKVSGTGGGTTVSTQAITVPGEHLWYAVPVLPNSQVHVSLTGLTANLDVTVFSDIGQAFTDLTKQNDLTQLSAQQSNETYAPRVYMPRVYMPRVYMPDGYGTDNLYADLYAPDAYSPTVVSDPAYSASAYSAGAFSPANFNPGVAYSSVFNLSMFDGLDAGTLSQAFSSAQVTSIVGASANNGTDNESVTANTWNTLGYYYVRVGGRNGATSPTAYSLQISTSGGPCDNVQLSDYASDPTLVGSPGPTTLILTDPTRLANQANVPVNGAQMTALGSELATLASTTNGTVVDVGASTRVADLNAQADANPGCPYAKNLVAQAIRDIVNSYRGSPNALQNVVIVGADGVIPFFRYPDEAGLGPESDYVPPVSDASPSQASLRSNEYLSQDAYGSAFDLTVHGTPLPVPDVAVGRLVETPSEITGIVHTYNTATDPVIRPHSTLVTGYDFLADTANQVADDFSKANAGGTNDTLISQPGAATPWTATDLAHSLLGSRHDVTFLAGHFSANDALAADFQTDLLTSDVANSSTNFSQSLIFSAGCHSGYNIVDQDGIPGLTNDLDWAQAFAQKGATLIAGAGYQYGDTDFVAYSEKLYALFAHDLREGTGPVNVGAALTQAKLDYLSTLTSVQGIDQKSVLEATLFGLPMQAVDFPTGRLGTPTTSGGVTPTPVPTDPGATLGLQSASLTVNPTLQQHSLALNNGAVQATWLSGDNGTLASPLAPVLPLVSANVTPTATTSGTVLRGVGLWSGTYTDTPGVTPLTSTATFDRSAMHSPFVNGGFYPESLSAPNYIDALDGGPTYLNITPAQYQSDAPGSATDVQRAYSSLGYRLYYSNNLSTYGTNTPAKSAPPSITAVTSTPTATGVNVSAVVTGDPAAGIQGVWVTYTVRPTSGGQGTWQSVDLTQDSANSTLWHGVIPVGATNQAALGFMIQAVNGVGLVGRSDNWGQLYPDLPANAAATTVTVDKLANPTPAFGDNLPVGASLTDKTGAPIVGAPVTFAVGRIAATAVTDSTGHASASLALNLDPGSYDLTASFAGNSSYAAQISTLPLTVVQRGTTLGLGRNADGSFTATLQDNTGAPVVGETVTVVATDSTGGVLATQSGITNAAGQVQFPASAAPDDTAALTAWFGDPRTPALGGGTSNQSVRPYAPSKHAMTLLRRTVLKLGSDIAVSGAFGDSLAVDATLTTSRGAAIPNEPISFSISSSSTLTSTVTATTDANGYASASLPLNVASGTDSLSASFAGDSTFAGSSSAAAAVSVTQRATGLTLTQNADGTFTAVLKDGRGAVLNNPDGSALHAPVTLEYVNATGATVDSAPATTNDSGTAGFPANAIPSTVTGVYASFAGSTNYQPSTSSSLRPTWPTTITITDDTGGSANYAAPVSFTVTVNVPTGLGGSAPTGTVTLFVDGQNAKTLPLSSGSAVFKTTTLPPLQDDKTAHAITATYSGDATFKPSTNSNTVNHIVVCGKQRYTGTYAASLSFTKALTYCLYNATVNGSLTVSGGANVAIVNAKLVGGTINANGAAQVMLCGSNAGGGLSVTNSTGAVVVGDPSALCAADTSSGSFNFQYDPNGVRAIGYTASNTVCKSVGGRNVPWPTDVSSISGCSI